MITCPRCMQPLEAKKHEQVRSWLCQGCAGEVLLLPAVRRIHAGVGDLLWRAARAASVGQVTCPFCRMAMRRVQEDAERPELDVCLPCMAVWCDAGEREKLTRAPGQTTVPPSADARAVLGRAMLDHQERVREAGRTGKAPEDPVKALLGYLGLPVLETQHDVPLRPWLTWGVIVALVLVHLLTLGHHEAIVAAWGFTPAHWWHWGGLTVVTSFFLHGGWLHLVGNLYFLGLIGDAVEGEIGRRRMLLLLAGALVVDALVEVITMGQRTTPGIGASGGIAALMGFFAVIHPRAQVCVNFRILLWLRFPAWVAFSLWVGFQVVIAVQMLMGHTNINGIAHLAGAVFGLVAGWWWKHQQRKVGALTSVA